jgi:hypothetical protein
MHLLSTTPSSADANLITLCKALGGGWESTYEHGTVSR